MTRDQIEHMVGRFLCWRLPDTFNPDGGVSFEREVNGKPRPDAWWPNGTNVLDADQAGAMVRHMIEGLPVSEFSWLIEAPGPCYLATGGDRIGHMHFRWVDDACTAIRFATQEQAENVFLTLRDMKRELFTSPFTREPRAVEHGFIGIQKAGEQ